MGKTSKIFGILLLLIVVVIAGLFAFVRYYLTEERVKGLVVPRAETALGREVAIGDIKIGLFSGITIRDFLIKEADGKTNFVSAKAFVLSYDLLPLLQKKLIISELRFDEPAINISRNKNGQFNYATLAILGQEAGPQQDKEPAAAAAGLPLALTINEIKLNKARVTVDDQMGEIPAVDATANASFNIALGRTMQDLQFSGSFDFDAAVAYGETQTRLDGKGNVNRRDMDIVLDTNLDGEQVHAQADVKNYLQAPNATVAISSKSLNIDKLLGIAAALPASGSGKKSAKPTPPETGSGDIIAEALPEGLVAQGTVTVDQARYKGLTASDFVMAFELSKGILAVKELSARAYGGKVDSDLTVDLNKPGPAYEGKLGLQSLQAADFSSDLLQRLKGMLSGSLASTVSFSGSGTTWSQLRKVLTADGSFTLSEGGIKNMPVTMSIANLLGLQELNTISYKNISGTFNIVEGGRMKIDTNLEGADLDAEAQGIIGLDGSLDLPLTFHLAPPLAEKLRAKASFAKYLTGEEGAATLHLKLAGSLRSPRPTLDMKGVQEQLQKEVIKQLEGSGQDSGEKPSKENIIKGILNR